MKWEVESRVASGHGWSVRATTTGGVTVSVIESNVGSYRITDTNFPEGTKAELLSAFREHRARLRAELEDIELSIASIKE